MTEGIYLLHFDPPLAHARHYLGWARNLDERLRHHLNGKGARIVRAAVNASCRVELVRTWPGADRTEERRMKNTKAVGRIYCPICSFKGER